MDKNEQKPSLRFKGYTYAWELHNLSDISHRFDNQRIPIEETKRIPGTTPYYGANGIQDFVKGYTHKGEYILIAEDGANNIKLYPVLYVNGEIWANNHVHVLQTKELVANNLFLSYALSSVDFEPFLVGGGRTKLNASTLISVKINIPSNLSEQKKLGDLLSNLDSVITLHQRKCDKLREIKASLLEKMFPKNNSNFHILRFKGYNYAWEQNKLFQVADYRNGKAHEQNITVNGKYVVVNSKFISTNGDIKKYTDKLIEPLKKGEIAFVLSDVPNGRAIARTYLIQDNNRYSLNQRISGITPLKNTDSYFLSILMNRNKYFLLFDDGVKQTNLSKSDVEQFSTFYPNIDEQTKIGNLFSNLDSAITLHHQKCDKLQNIKQALLSKMFV